MTRRSADRLSGNAALALCFCCLPLGGCGAKSSEAARPHGIVLLLLDTVRADRLTVYDAERRTTPTLAALAERGTTFERVQAAAPWTVPSVASLWTGLHPTLHGAGLTGDGPRMFDPQAIRGFDRALQTLPRRMKELGYRTYGRISNELFADCFSAGFDEIEVERGPARAVVDWAVERVPGMQQAPFFLYLHFMDAHIPLEPPKRIVRRFLPPGFELDAVPPAARSAAMWGSYKKLDALQDESVNAFRVVKEATYDAALFTIDQEIARLQESLRVAGLLDDTLFVVAADHGEEFWEHWEVQRRAYDLDSRIAVGTGHGHTLFQELLHVPLILAGPRVPAGRRVATRVRLLDLGTTLLELAGGSGALGEGQSLVPLFSGAPGPDRPSFSESLVYGYDQHALVDADGFKLIRSTRVGERELLFDLDADPLETNDLLEREPARAALLRAALESMARELESKRGAAGEVMQGLDVEHLRELGYAGSESEDG